MKLVPSFVAAVVLAVSFSLTPSHASIIVIGPTGSSTGNLTITQDITFTITSGLSAGNTIDFVLDNWVTQANQATTFSSMSPQLSLSKNGAGAQTYGAGVLADNYGTNPSTVFTANDGYFTTSSPGLVINDTLTLKAGSYNLAATAGDTFNPQATQTFTGNMFIVGNGNVMSNTVAAVPEPASVALFSMAGLGLLSRRRRLG